MVGLRRPLAEGDLAEEVRERDANEGPSTPDPRAHRDMDRRHRKFFLTERTGARHPPMCTSIMDESLTCNCSWLNPLFLCSRSSNNPVYK